MAAEQIKSEQPQGAPLPIIRCAKCKRRLFDGFLYGVIKCYNCNWIMNFIDKNAEQVYSQAHLR